MKKIFCLIAILTICFSISAQTDSEFNPRSPQDPGANSWNPVTGELYIDLFEPGTLYAALSNLLGDSYSDYEKVKSFTVVVPMASGDFRQMAFPNCEFIDLGRSGGFSTVPANAFLMTTSLKTLILPSSVKEIVDAMPSTLELLDIHATTPPTVSETLWMNITDPTNLIVRVPSGSVDAYKNALVWKNARIRSLEGGGEETEAGSIQLRILTPEGEDVSSQANIVWYLGSTQLGEGNKLESIEVGTTVSYHITLSSALSLSYEAPAEGTITVSSSSLNVQSITLEAISTPVVEEKDLKGSDIRLNLEYKAAADDASFVVPSNDLQFQVFRANGEELTDFVFLPPMLRFEENVLSAEELITLRVTSRTGLFQQTETTVEGNSSQLSATVLLKECGIATISFASSEGITDIQCSVYDSKDRYMATYPHNGTGCTVEGLPDGEYTAVLMQRSQFFARIQQLSDLATAGLRAGTDYAQLNIRQEAGTTKSYSAQVPALDESRFRHTSEGASFTSNTATVNAGFYATLKAKVQFKEEYAAEVSNVNLIVDIPDGCNYMENSLITSLSEGSFSRDGKRLVIPVQNSETVRLCIVPETAGSHSPSALLRYTLGGKQYQLPIGTALIEAKELEIDMPEITTTPTFHVSGIAPESRKMTIYDGNQKIGETRALSNGEWKTDVTLQNPISHTFHQIYAEYENESGHTSRTATMNILYDENAQASLVSRIQIKTQGQTLSYDCTTDTFTPKYYSFNPARNSSFTFTAEMQENKPENIQNPQFYVDLSNGLTSIIDATYNEQLKLWTATGSFPGSENLPVGASFCFDYLDGSEFDATALENTEVQELMESSEMLKAFDGDYFHVDEILEDTEEKVKLLFHIGYDDERLLVEYNMVDFAQAEALVNQERESVIELDEDSLICYTEIEDDWMRTYYLDYTTNEAWYVLFGTEELLSKTPQRKEMTFLGVVSNIKRGANLVGKLSKGFKTLGEEAIKEVKDFIQDKKDLMFAKVYYDEMVSLRDQYAANLGNQVWACTQALGARCPDGKWRVREAVRPAFQSFILEYSKDSEDFLAKFDAYIAAYEKTVITRCGAEYLSAIGTAVTGGLGKVTTGAAVKGRHVIRNITKIAPRFGTYKEVTNFVADGAKDGLEQIAKKLGIDTDFMAIKNFICRWAPSRYFLCADNLLELLSDIKSAYQECKDDEPGDTPTPTPPSQPRPKRRRRPQPKIINIRPIIDPSGFVYEAVPENRVEGVTATIYYSETNPGMSAQPSAQAGILWNAEEYGQQNPLQTDSEGLYSWDVPQGWWQVRFEKEGYEPTQTEWLPVPPPQLEVNIPMRQVSAPTIEKATAYPNTIDITFSKFMQVSSLTGFSVSQNNGQTISGHIETVDEQDGLAKQACFIPDTPLSGTSVTLCIPASVKSYADTTMSENWENELEIEQSFNELLVEDQIQLSIGQENSFELWCKPSPAGTQPTIVFDSDFLSLTNDPIFDTEGKAIVKMEGILPGSTDVTLSIGDLSVTTTVVISYDQWKTVCNPIANILSGTAVAKGTAIELMVPTEGATIYYTLDGSCPCEDSAARFEYDGTPIIIDKDVTIRAIAMKADMLDSKVMEFQYTLSTGIATPSQILPTTYFTLSGLRALPPLKPGLYIQRTTSGTKKIRIR